MTPQEQDAYDRGWLDWQGGTRGSPSNLRLIGITLLPHWRRGYDDAAVGIRPASVWGEPLGDRVTGWPFSWTKMLG